MINVSQTKGGLVINAVGSQDQINLELAKATAQILLKMTREDMMSPEDLLAQGRAWGEFIGGMMCAMNSPENKKHIHDYSFGMEVDETDKDVN